MTEQPEGPAGDRGGDTPSISRKRKAREAGIDPKRLAKYQRGAAVATRKLTDRKLKGKLQHNEQLVQQAAQQAAKAEEWLLPSEPGTLETEGTERSYRLSQAAIAKEAAVGASRKVFDLALDQLGPYSLAFNRSGRQLLLGGRKGHLALLDWQQARPLAEVQVKETVRDVSFLHNQLFFAAAQKKYVYIYDHRGLEVHCMKEHEAVQRLEFLPYHFLLSSVGNHGVLRYQDTSTGQIVAQHRTKLGPCNVMRQNPWNAVLALGHGNGCVTHWTPNMATPAVKMLCHRGPIKAIAIDPTGHHMVTAGFDSMVKVWDVRTFKPMHAYRSPAPPAWLDISQRGMLAVGHGRRVQVWQDALTKRAPAPYLTHSLSHGLMTQFRFCPYEDVLGIGHTGGVSTILVPGTGEPNYDSMVADPFQGRKARREAEVHNLLEKLQPDMIVLDPSTIGQVRREPEELQQDKRQAEAEANAARRREQEARNEAKTRMKGKNRPSKRYRKKRTNIVDDKKGAIREDNKEAQKYQQRVEIPANAPKLLHRFFGRRPKG